MERFPVVCDTMHTRTIISTSVKIHPDFNPEMHQNDVAVIDIKQVQPVLSRVHVSRQTGYENHTEEQEALLNTTAYSMGWG